MSGKSLFKRIDWLTIFIYIALVVIGWVNIYSSTFTDTDPSIFNFSSLHGKQLFFFGVSILAIILIMALEANFYERFSSLLYVIAIVLLLGFLSLVRLSPVQPHGIIWDFLTYNLPNLPKSLLPWP